MRVFLEGKSVAWFLCGLAAFLSDVSGPTNVSGAISVSNLLGLPPGIPSTGSSSDKLYWLSKQSDTDGSLEFYCFNRDGTMTSYETTAGSPGSGLTANGTLGPGMTYTVLLREILTAANHTGAFNGYCWIVANFDAVAGTYNVTIFGLGFTQSFELLPGVGGFQTNLP